jgi:O-antigen ligase
MRFVLPLVAAILPVVIAPGILFYFDVTPKVVFLLIGTAIALILWRGELPVNSRLNRIFYLLLAAEAISIMASTLSSTHPALSLNGGNWRRFGLISQLAVLMFAALVGADCAANRERVTVYLKAIVVGAIPVALYAVLQYFGWDPWLPKQSYHAGEDTWSIVRPPSTMGHASYLATYLLFVAFACFGLWQQRTWRIIAAAVAALSCVAIVMSGTRAALLGLAGGVTIAVWTNKRKRAAQLYVAAAVILCLALYWSPAGQGLRNRVTWISSEPLGGARPLLWRDSLRMSVHRLALGYGPETFIREFPHQESIELARAYPDFLHESPHNIFLDALVSQGALGLLILAALCAWGLLAARQTPWARAALIAVIIAQLFTAFILPTSFFFLLTLALVVEQGPSRRLPLARMAAVCCAVLLAACALRLFVADRALSSAGASLDRGDLAGAVRSHQMALTWALPGSSSELYYSRRLADFVRTTPDFGVKSRGLREALNAALSATHGSEEMANAWYNLAGFLSMTHSPPDVERSLREAIDAAPNWYKPHWVLAQLLVTEHRLDDARHEAEIAVSCNGKAPEVLYTLENIRAAQRH